MHQRTNQIEQIDLYLNKRTHAYALYIKFSDNNIVKSKELIKNKLVADYDEAGELIGFDVQCEDANIVLHEKEDFE